MNMITNKLLRTITAAAMAGAMLAGCSGGAVSSAPTAPTAPSAPSEVKSFDLAHEISVVSREPGSGTRGAFIELFKVQEKTADGTKTDRTSDEATVVSKTDIMLQTVAGDPWSIGYVSLGSLNDSVKAVSIDGVAPSSEAMLSGTYKISRPFNIATKGAPQGLAKDFIDFVLSAEGQAVVAKSYVPINSGAPAYSGTKPAGKIVIGGSSSVYPAMEKLVEAYALVNPNAKTELQSSDSTAGMSGTAEGIFDIGMASRDLSDTEKETLTPVSIAIDGIAVIVNPENPTAELTSAAVKGIFVGETVKWSDISSK
ncbi:MAG: substrate-binding domain-containing protein [Angelakisella sp.]